MRREDPVSLALVGTPCRPSRESGSDSTSRGRVDPVADGLLLDPLLGVRVPDLAELHLVRSDLGDSGTQVPDEVQLPGGTCRPSSLLGMDQPATMAETDAAGSEESTSRSGDRIPREPHELVVALALGTAADRVGGHGLETETLRRDKAVVPIVDHGSMVRWVVAQGDGLLDTTCRDVGSQLTEIGGSLPSARVRFPVLAPQRHQGLEAHVLDRTTSHALAASHDELLDPLGVGPQLVAAGRDLVEPLEVEECQLCLGSSDHVCFALAAEDGGGVDVDLSLVQPRPDVGREAASRKLGLLLGVELLQEVTEVAGVLDEV